MSLTTGAAGGVLRVVFAGTPDFAVPTLRALADNAAPRCEIVAVLTQPDRPAGRGRKPRASAVKACALELGLDVRQPSTLRDAALQDELVALRSDLMVVAAYGLLLPRTVLDIPRHGCVNVHASVLPRWRGAAPVHRAILAGDAHTGVSIMQMEAGLDTGPVIHVRTTPIDAEVTTGELTARLADLGARAMTETLPAIAGGACQATPQDNTYATHAAKIAKCEALIDWSQPALSIHRQVRAFNPWPVAETRLQGRQLRVWSAGLVAGGDDRRPGRVLAAGADGIDVATGDGVLRLTRVQLAGSRPMAARDFVNAHNVVGAQLGGDDGAG